MSPDVEESIRCSEPDCSCLAFRPGSVQLRSCDLCGHGWVAHALEKLQARPASSCGPAEVALPGPVFDLSSLVLYGAQAVPVQLKILLDRLYSILSPEQVGQILHSLGWTLGDYIRGYMLQYPSGQVLDCWSMVSPEEEPLVLRQFLRFGETRPIVELLTLQDQEGDHQNSGPDSNNETKEGTRQVVKQKTVHLREDVSGVHSMLLPFHGPLSNSCLLPSTEEPVSSRKLTQILPTSRGTEAERQEGGRIEEDDDVLWKQAVSLKTDPDTSSPLLSLWHQTSGLTEQRGDRTRQKKTTNPSSSFLLCPPVSNSSSSLLSPPVSNSSSSLLCPPVSNSSSSLLSPPVSNSSSSLLSPPVSNSSSSLLCPPVSNSSFSLMCPPVSNSSSSLLSPPVSNSSSSLLCPPVSNSSSSLLCPPVSNSSSSHLHSQTCQRSPSSLQPLPSFSSSFLCSLRTSSLSPSMPPLPSSSSSALHPLPSSLCSFSSLSLGGCRKGRVSCGVCGKSFYDKGTLKIHYNAVHLKIKHRCTIVGCTMVFSSLRSRNRHSANPNPRLHTGACRDAHPYRAPPEHTQLMEGGLDRRLRPEGQVCRGRESMFWQHSNDTPPLLNRYLDLQHGRRSISPQEAGSPPSFHPKTVDQNQIPLLLLPTGPASSVGTASCRTSLVTNQQWRILDALPKKKPRKSSMPMKIKREREHSEQKTRGQQ